MADSWVATVFIHHDASGGRIGFFGFVLGNADRICNVSLFFPWIVYVARREIALCQK